MSGLFSLLFFALFFYLMMRFGCGAHMAHGKNTANEHDQKHDYENKNMQVFIDPICESKVEDDEGYGMLHEGKLYRFICKKHIDEFDQNPSKYINKKLTGEES